MKKRELRLSIYEELLFYIIFNAQEKLIAAITLYKSKLSYSSAYFLTVIAEEELSKLILLPFAKEADELDELLSEEKRKSSGYFKHPVKQKIFSSYGLQNRTDKDIEIVKQNCLYIGANNKLIHNYKPTSPEKVIEELKHAIKLYMKFVIENSVLTGGDLSKNFRDAVFAMTTNIFLPCVKTQVPEIIEKIQLESQALEIVRKANERTKSINHIEMFSNPYMLFDMLKHALGKNYQKFISETKYMSYTELLKHLEPYLRG